MLCQGLRYLAFPPTALSSGPWNHGATRDLRCSLSFALGMEIPSTRWAFRLRIPQLRALDCVSLSLGWPVLILWIDWAYWLCHLLAGVPDTHEVCKVEPRNSLGSCHGPHHHHHHHHHHHRHRHRHHHHHHHHRHRHRYHHQWRSSTNIEV